MRQPAAPRDARDDLIPHEDRGEVLETPQDKLGHFGHTPRTLMFIRNNNPYPPGTDTLRPLPLSGTLDIAGLEGQPLALALTALADLPYTEVEAVMQCAGNGRAFYRDAQQIEGSHWRRGGVMNAVFGGVRLCAALGTRRPLAEARFLTATGADRGEGYEKSLPLAEALERALLVTHLNGEPLAGAHGGPLRLFMPGYFGTVNVKWLRRLTFTAGESAHEAQQKRYRVPTAGGGSRPCWHMPLKSLIFQPTEGQVLKAGAVTVCGVAFNDGACGLERVEITLDGGATWRRAEMAAGHGPYAWRRWTLALDLPPGAHEIASCAVDARGARQPLDGNATWNPEGYEWQGVDRVRVRVQK